MNGHKTRFRIRLGEYRLVYEINEANQVILILKLDDRGDICWILIAPQVLGYGAFPVCRQTGLPYSRLTTSDRTHHLPGLVPTRVGTHQFSVRSLRRHRFRSESLQDHLAWEHAARPCGAAKRRARPGELLSFGGQNAFLIGEHTLH